MTARILLCSDMDRTLLPNGAHPESPGARERLRHLVQRPEVTLAYVTGRNRQLILEAIEAYDLPHPDFAVGDVGATIYRVHDGRWHVWDNWERKIASDWKGMDRAQLSSLLEKFDELELQEPEKQGRFKLSYYTPVHTDQRRLRRKMSAKLDEADIQASIIWSVDEAADKGLMDVLPESATKHQAVRFIMQQEGFAEKETVFAGDSGNDMPALTSGLQAVMVSNASDAVRTEALREMHAKAMTERLYIAKGGFLGMNGNYAAGILEGLAHFVPETAAWLD